MQDMGLIGRRGLSWVFVNCAVLTIAARSALALPPKPDPVCAVSLLPSPPPGAPTAFGASAAISGDLVVVGLRDYVLPQSAPVAGAIETFARRGTAWLPQGGLLRPDDSVPGDGFGESVAVSGDTLLAGARGRGGAYVFTHAGNAWLQQTFLLSAEIPRASGDVSVALDGDTAAVSLSYQLQEQIPGTVLVYTRSAGHWQQQGAALTVARSADFDGELGPLALSGDTLLVGAPALGGSPDAPPLVGKAFVFVRKAGEWQQQGPALSGDANPTFGSAVALSGDTALVGSHRSWSSDLPRPDGSVYTFDRRGETWASGAVLTRPGFDSFGRSLAVVGELAWVGAPGAINGGPEGQGAVFQYTRGSGQWLPSNAFANGYWGTVDPEAGWSLGVSGGQVVAGALGAAYVIGPECFSSPTQGTAGATSTNVAGAAGMPDLELGGSTSLAGSAAFAGGSADCAGHGCLGTLPDADQRSTSCGCRLSARSVPLSAWPLATLALLGVARRRRRQA